VNSRAFPTPPRFLLPAKDGAPFSKLGQVRLPRSNDVAGSTAERREWRITGSEPADLLR
jgi:hypothetical protein